MIDFYKQIILHLEVLMQQNDLITDIFIIKKDNKLTGFQFSNNVEKVVLRNGEYIEQGSIIELYLKAKNELGINNRSAMIKALRIVNNLTQNELAKKLGITKQEIYRWENGVKPNEMVYETILKHFE